MASPEKIRQTFSQLFDNYKKWVVKNPNLISDIESTVKYMSFFTAGRFNNSTFASELVYSLPNLMILFNDQLIRAIKFPDLKLPSLQSKLKIWLTIIDYTEALFEVSAKRICGEAGRWFIITLIQFLKAVMRLLLVFRYKEKIVQTPAIQPLNREKLDEAEGLNMQKEEGFALKRSGKVIRTVRSSSNHLRTWKPPSTSKLVNEKEEVSNHHVQALKKSLLFAETMYILKPIIHLGCLSMSGPRNWNPWVLSFAIDLVTLRIFNQEKKLTFDEKEELCRRKIGLLLYLLRSPFYDNCSRMKIFSMLEIVSRTVPLAKIIAEPIARYLPHWQNTYFYMWSS